MSTQLDQIAKPSRECNLGSPLREIRSAGSARGDGHKRLSRKTRPYPPCARLSPALSAGETPASERDQPTHRESSLGLMKVTT